MGEYSRWVREMQTQDGTMGEDVLGNTKHGRRCRETHNGLRGRVERASAPYFLEIAGIKVQKEKAQVCRLRPLKVALPVWQISIMQKEVKRTATIAHKWVP